MSVVIETTIGDITVDLFIEERPIASLNFIKLCKLKYYNFNLFHNVERGFIAQSGDPTGAGDGGSSVWGVVEGPHKRFFESESLPKIRHTTPGLISLVSVGNNLVGSQFFFTLGSDLTSLDGMHCVIGEVVEGHEVLRKLNETIVDEKFRPFQDIRITHTVVLDDPYPDPRGFRVASRSPSPSVERMQNGRIGADEDIDDTGGKTLEEIQEMLAEREAKARATILEIVGDLPDADMAPPENVLFVCKLNPVTTDDDLEIIFSRFGKVKGCEVIRDKKTGDSLQYAFVEFEEQKSCEAAYFKMDNVLIDDRRIHVDFSQSVAKVKWRGKGRGVEGHEGRLDFNNLKDTNKNIRKDHKRDDMYKQEKGRDRMRSEERVQARMERHRKREEEEKSERTRRSRSRSNQRYFDNRGRTEVRAAARERSGIRPDFRNYQRRSRSKSGECYRKRVSDSRHSSKLARYDTHSPNRRRKMNSAKHPTREYPEANKSNKSENRKKNNVQDKLQRKKKLKTKSKKRTHTSSDDTSSVSSDSTSTKSESTTSTGSSSSGDIQKKRKKSKSKRKASKKSKKCKK